jgi:hypothetical protein
MVQATASQAARSGDRKAMIELYDRVYVEWPTNMYYALLIVGAVGWVLLGVGLYRGRVVPRAAAGLTRIGGAAIYLTGPGPVWAFVLGSTVISLVGFAWTAKSAAAAVSG